MMHPRLTPGNGRVAHVSLEGIASADRFVAGTLRQVAVPVADLLREPAGALDGQMLRGASFLVLETDFDPGWSFGQAQDDGYVGYVETRHLRDFEPVTHKVTALATHAYQAADIKSRALQSLPFGAEVAVTGRRNRFHVLRDGTFVPSQHLRPLQQMADDFVAVFERFLGVPYLWGGNSPSGMDCSGALQLALMAAGTECPRDADMQEIALGRPLPSGAAPMRGDLVFWDGHVGVMRDPETLLHANAHHMAVTTEPFAVVVDRVIANGGGPVTAIRRLAG